MRSSPAVSLDPQTLLSAYAQGVFPMADRDGVIRWFTADPRGIIPLENFHIPRTLRQAVKQNRFEIRINHDFPAVMRGCMNARRGETWINDRLIEAYVRLNQLGFAHSVECWQDDQLAGGLYGVTLGGQRPLRAENSQSEQYWDPAALRAGPAEAGGPHPPRRPALRQICELHQVVDRGNEVPWLALQHRAAHRPRTAPERADRRGQPAGLCDTVGIDEAEKFAPRLERAEISSLARQQRTMAAHNPDPQTCGAREHGIIEAGIHDDDLEIAI